MSVAGSTTFGADRPRWARPQRATVALSAPLDAVDGVVGAVTYRLLEHGPARILTLTVMRA